VFAIDANTGEPSLIQTIEGYAIQLRSFGIDPGGRLLVAASIKPLLVREGNAVKTLTAGIMTYRIADDGTLAFVRKYDVDTGKGHECGSGRVGLAGGGRPAAAAAQRAAPFGTLALGGALCFGFRRRHLVGGGITRRRGTRGHLDEYIWHNRCPAADLHQ